VSASYEAQERFIRGLQPHYPLFKTRIGEISKNEIAGEGYDLACRCHERVRMIHSRLFIRVYSYAFPKETETTEWQIVGFASGVTIG
jgi:hypothetical protein